MKTIIEPVHMDLIIDHIHRGRCVPFLGAGANVSSPERGYSGLPLGAEVARKLAEKMGFTGVGLDSNLELMRIALEFEFNSDRDGLVSALKTILNDAACEPSPLLRILADLPFELIITTNYDQLMERALIENNKKFELLVQPKEGFQDGRDTRKRFNELEEYQGLILYKLHGTFLPDAPDDRESSPLIVTEDDYIDFMSNFGRDAVPKLILKKVIPNTLLFFGYSLRDWDFRAIFKMLPHHVGRMAFAIFKDPPNFWVQFLRSKGFWIYDMDLYEFAEELEQSYRRRYGMNQTKRN